jgi:prolyl 4-hydroxylase
LNDVPEGGETAFFHARRAIAPKAGRLLVFRNAVPRTAPDGRTRFEVDRRSLHAGLPVRAGTKWIVTTFVRERPRGMEEEP